MIQKEKPPVTESLELGEYEKAREHYEKSLSINKEIGDRNGESDCYANLGSVYQSVDKFDKATEHLEKALAIKRKSVTEMEKATVTNALEGCISQLATLIKLTNT